MLVMRERFFDIGDDYDVTDESGRKLYRVDGKALSLRGRVVIRDVSGREVAEVVRKLVSLRRTYEIRIGGEAAAQVRKHMFTPFRDRFTIDIPGPHDLTMTGDLIDHEYAIEQDGAVVATVSKRWLRIKDTYAIDIVQGVNPVLILASVTALELSRQRDADSHNGKE